MPGTRLENVNIISQELLPTPEQIKTKHPLNDLARATVIKGRHTVEQVLDRMDPRIFVVLGPCSIHDLTAAREYADRLADLASQVSETMLLIMRVYFEKPRTAVGWKGFINDQRLDDSFHIEEGLDKARGFLLELAEMGIPTGTEALDPISPQYLSDLITWTAIGARTTESQTHREMSSGLSTPIGFKNGTDGGLDVAINALHAASSPHSFLGIDQRGRCAVTRTRGNRYGHVVLRGGGGKPNYDSVEIAQCEAALTKAGLPSTIVVDCSHANSNKDYRLQPLVMENCVNQIVEGNRSIVGLMVESHLHDGNQSIPQDLSELRYGTSVTDACVDWETTESMILQAHDKLKSVLAMRLEAETTAA